MARQKNNIVMRSTRGMVGKQIVFKRRAGKPYVAAPPEVNENRVPTANQLAAQQKFRTSSAFAKLAMQSPMLKAAYKAKAKRNQTAFNIAFNDAYFAPTVIGIITDGYTGASGSIILGQATDNFKVASVKVTIMDGANQVVEEGPATATQDGLNWSYAATVAVANLAGYKVKATALDTPENEGFLEVNL
jgi:hypothetical protein